MNVILRNIIKKSDEELGVPFEQLAKERIQSSIERNKAEISKTIFLPTAKEEQEEIKEALDPKLKKVLQQIVKKWQDLGPTSKNLDKAIDMIAKTSKVKLDKKEVKKKILDGDVSEAVWIVNKEISNKSNFNYLLDLEESGHRSSFKFNRKTIHVTSEDAHRVLTLVEDLNVKTQDRIKNLLDKDVISFQKIIQLSKKED